jgi:hypothetical protein
MLASHPIELVHPEPSGVSVDLVYACHTVQIRIRIELSFRYKALKALK